MTDYAELLRKYIGYVRDCEGVDFIEYGDGFSDVQFTPEEWAELERLAKESHAQSP